MIHFKRFAYKLKIKVAKETSRRREMEESLRDLGNPLDEMTFHQKKKLSLYFYFSHLKVDSIFTKPM